MACSKNTEKCKVKKGTPLPKCCVEHVYEMAEYITDIFGDEVYWAEFGTLLGAVREGGLIGGDHDLDFGTLTFKPIDKHPERFEAQPRLDLQTGEPTFYRLYYSDTNRIYADIFLFKDDGDLVTRRTMDYWYNQCDAGKGKVVDVAFNSSFLDPLIEVDFGGVKLKSPNNPEKFLEGRYTNWRVPSKTDISVGGVK